MGDEQVGDFTTLYKCYAAIHSLKLSIPWQFNTACEFTWAVKQAGFDTNTVSSAIENMSLRLYREKNPTKNQTSANMVFLGSEER